MRQPKLGVESWRSECVAARVLLTYIDGEALGDRVYGEVVYRAMWYAMASLLVLAMVFRVCLGHLPAPDRQLDEHRMRGPKVATVLG